MLSRKLQSSTAAVEPAVGQMIFAGNHTTGFPGYASYSFVVPSGVNEISAVCVDSGQTGARSDSAARGGNGGSLRYATAISVTPGETLEIRVAEGAYNRTDRVYSSDGTSILRGSTVLLKAWLGGSTAIGGNVGGGDGGVAPVSNTTYSSGGGGAAGYAGDGGGGMNTGGTFDSVPTPNGGGAYGGQRSTGIGGASGGVGLTGIGPTASSVYTGAGDDAQYSVGSYGLLAKVGSTQRNPGFGSGGNGNDASSGVGGSSGPGACRIIWGGGRSYPSNAADVLTYTGTTYGEIEVRIYSATGEFYLYRLALLDGSNTNILSSMTGVAGSSSASFAGLSAGQFTIKSATNLTAAQVDGLKGTATGTIYAAQTNQQPPDYISLLVKPAAASTIKAFTYNCGTDTTSQSNALFAVEILGDGENITGGMAAMRGDYTGSESLAQTITFT